MKTNIKEIRCTQCNWQGYPNQLHNYLKNAGQSSEELFKKCPKCRKVDLCFDLFEDLN